MCPAYLQPSCQHHIEAPQQKAGSRRLPANRFSNMLLGASNSPPWARDQTAACILRQWFPPREVHLQSNPDLHPLPPHHQTLCLEQISWGQISNWLITWKEALSIAMKWKSKNPVGVKKSLLHSITMVDVNVNVQHARVMFQKLSIKMWRWPFHKISQAYNFVQPPGWPRRCHWHSRSHWPPPFWHGEVLQTNWLPPRQSHGWQQYSDGC